LPAVLRLRVKLALRKENDGMEHNRVLRFELVGIEPPEPFAPPHSTNGQEGGPRA
jgi:hypothetical protein